RPGGACARGPTCWSPTRCWTSRCSRAWATSSRTKCCTGSASTPRAGSARCRRASSPNWWRRRVSTASTSTAGRRPTSCGGTTRCTRRPPARATGTGCRSARASVAPSAARSGATPASDATASGLEAAGGVAEDARHPRELLLQRCLGVAAREAPAGLDLAPALAPAVAGLAVGNALAAVVLPFTGRAGAEGGVAVDADRAQRDAARLRVAGLGHVAVVARRVAAVDGRWRQAVGRGDAGGRRRLRALRRRGRRRGGGRGRRCGLGIGGAGHVGGQRRWRLHHGPFLARARRAGFVVLDGQRAAGVGAAVDHHGVGGPGGRGAGGGKERRQQQAAGKAR